MQNTVAMGGNGRWEKIMKGQGKKDQEGRKKKILETRNKMP